MSTTTAPPYIITPDSLIFYNDGIPVTVFRGHEHFVAIAKLVEAGDVKEAIRLAQPAVGLAEAITEAEAENPDAFVHFRRTAGDLQVTPWGVTLNGEPLHGYVIDRLLEVLKLGLDITPWKNFVTKLYQNPSSVSRNELYLWMEKAQMPITSDGDFLAFKRVRSNYRDIHSGRFDNSVGQVVSMPRLDVDDDRNRTCSAGLHFCGRSYLPSFASNGGSDHVMVVKINPADVVSIPVDYQFAKGRTWRYEVVGEVSLEEAGLRQWGVYSDDYDGYTDEDDGGDTDYDPDEEYDGDDTDDDDEVTIGEVFGAYARYSGNTSSKDGIARMARLYEASQILDTVVESFNDLTEAQRQDLVTAWG